MFCLYRYIRKTWASHFLKCNKYEICKSPTTTHTPTSIEFCNNNKNYRYYVYINSLLWSINSNKNNSWTKKKTRQDQGPSLVVFKFNDDDDAWLTLPNNYKKKTKQNQRDPMAIFIKSLDHRHWHPYHHHHHHWMMMMFQMSKKKQR